MGRLRRPLGAFLILVSLVTPTAVQGCQGTTALGASLVLETATLHLPRAVSSGGEWFDGAAAPVVWMGSFFPFFGSPVLSADTASRFNLAVGMVSNYVGTLTFLLNIGLASAILGAKAVPRLRLARSVLASDRVWSVTRFLTYWIAVDAIAWLTPAPLRAAWLAVTTAALLGLTMMSKRLGFQAELRHWLPWFLVPAWLAALVVSASMLLFGLVGFLIGALLISSKSPATASDS
jgi:hypothetical protein